MKIQLACQLKTSKRTAITGGAFFDESFGVGRVLMRERHAQSANG